MSLQKLAGLIKEKNNVTVLGLDPSAASLPPYLAQKCSSAADFARAAYEFCAGLIDACADIVAAVKPQSAYFERLGPSGMETLLSVVEYAHKAGLYVILDAKRGDIGATSEAYAEAAFGEFGFGADALTVNPYLGSDGVAPFVKFAEKSDKGLFVLAKTSNPSSDEFQNVRTEGGLPMYLRVADKISEWGAPSIGESGYSNVGAVAGATYPSELAEIRKRVPHTFLLVPGYGAQGGTASDLAVAFDENGGGACVNASRSLMCAYKKAGDTTGADFGRYAREEAVRMRDELNKYRLK